MKLTSGPDDRRQKTDTSPGSWHLFFHRRADSTKPNMWLTNWVGDSIRKTETAIAKNYLTEREKLTAPTAIEKHFAEVEKEIKQLKAGRKRRGKNG